MDDRNLFVLLFVLLYRHSGRVKLDVGAGELDS